VLRVSRPAKPGTRIIPLGHIPARFWRWCRCTSLYEIALYSRSLLNPYRNAGSRAFGPPLLDFRTDSLTSLFPAYNARFFFFFLFLVPFPEILNPQNTLNLPPFLRTLLFSPYTPVFSRF